METIYLEESESTPFVEFNREGKLKIEGKSLPENVENFYRPLMNWVDNLDCESVFFKINIYYSNSASSKRILEMLRMIDSNNKIKDITVEWHYEEGDYDQLETGQLFEEMLMRAEFRYIEYEEELVV